MSGGDMFEMVASDADRISKEIVRTVTNGDFEDLREDMVAQTVHAEFWNLERTENQRLITACMVIQNMAVAILVLSDELAGTTPHDDGSDEFVGPMVFDPDILSAIAVGDVSRLGESVTFVDGSVKTWAQVTKDDLDTMQKWMALQSSEARRKLAELQAVAKARFPDQDWENTHRHLRAVDDGQPD